MEAVWAQNSGQQLFEVFFIEKYMHSARGVLTRASGIYPEDSCEGFMLHVNAEESHESSGFM